ncbi:metallophosphoesterase [Plastoroseomonas arctica]|uniref:Serine/threonine protein phosphatase n=1 Tax=Plastoroseomonas arctica TaxID=1509237 RepID=A0AAF1JVT9_9PROT|nr:metallophosphoesterase [Plastoroseomonas arctica]MBR0654775.1 serine/threonine protein phosphatase [Plastoroseomonas arctica]
MIAWQDAPASLPEGERIYAIPDIHGALAKLRAMHAMIAADLEARPVERPLLIHLGDYIDKGPDSRGVVNHLIAGSPCAALHLRGNHEDMMLASLAGEPGAEADWLWCGGRATLLSWGGTEDSWTGLITERQRDFLDATTFWHQAGGYFFTHAGIRPGVPLDAQDPDDLMRIRGEFLNSDRDHGAVIVHGHTAGFDPVIRPNRICLDTAAWSGGSLTCGVFEADRLGFLRA